MSFLALTLHEKAKDSYLILISNLSFNDIISDVGSFVSVSCEVTITSF